jgi:hypothetical protein
VQNELTFRQMVDGISALVAVLTPDGAVEFVNRQVLDYSVPAMIGVANSKGQSEYVNKRAIDYLDTTQSNLKRGDTSD